MNDPKDAMKALLNTRDFLIPNGAPSYIADIMGRLIGDKEPRAPVVTNKIAVGDRPGVLIVDDPWEWETEYLCCPVREFLDRSIDIMDQGEPIIIMAKLANIEIAPPTPETEPNNRAARRRAAAQARRSR